MNRKLLLPIIFLVALATTSCKEKNIEVNTTDGDKFLYVSSKVMEVKSITPNGGSKEIPAEEVNGIWGDRLALNTPSELYFKKDSLFISKPHNIIERYETLWRNDKLYLRSHNTMEWKFCGVKDTQNNAFILNFGLLKGSVKNDMRTLEILKQGYNYESYTDIIKNPESTILWTKMNLVYKKK